MKQNTITELWSVEAELGVLGGIIINNDYFDEVITVLKSNDFYSFTHKIIFDAITTLLLTNRKVDLITLDQFLKEKGALKDVGGFAYLSEIVNNTPSSSNTVAYAHIVVKYAKQRNFLKLGQFIVSEMQSSKTDEQLDTFSENIEKQYTEITLQNEEQDVADIGQVFNNILQKMENSSLEGNAVSGSPTGIIDLDENTTGGQPGELIILAGRPSMGKTAFSQGIAKHTLNKFTDKPVIYFSQEMPKEQLLQRFIAMEARVDLQRLRKATELDDEDWSKIAVAMGEIQNNWKNRLLIDDESNLTPQRLRTKARKYSRKYGKPAAIFVDYLQLMRSTSKRENRNLEISDISNSLKALAKELHCPVYALSQLNRSLEQRHNKRPLNSDLRDSGSLEQDADVIFFVYRDEVYEPDKQDKGIAEIIIGKQRNGPLGRVKCRFLGNYSLFENID
ncbi:MULTISPECIES: replicative DNA helicase [Pasteurellaceae]|uniref:Replicative DNA helicase n=1 Tax=Pasteurella atlantica TaxID=2827233 RepID=A0AAW8CP14_9PAST|nr:replicative DNA helicase [Pasteurella atlantica]MBR0573609.1 replicative DNA helicase [Pasteurella atlantica]MDP8039364.1 replicative DNA helicase [Pasteurella atlantica]MDP8041456.1 replicative DNA helicase [Pasteurella atlantica]MDP8043619.1 replicative DNA helicase [Pasteurella atlantica]MDP8045677.1 replicative DNA helicase [Pasteurella atlantica]